MRRIRFSIWQIALVLVLALGVISTALAAAHGLLPEWNTPWLLPLLVLVAIDAALTQRVVVQERLGLAEQGALRLAEAALLTVAARAASALAEGLSLRRLAEPWLRDPLAFFDGRFTEYALAAVLSWLLTTLLAQSVLDLEAEPPTVIKGLVSIDESALLQDRSLALARFDRLWLGCVLLALIGAAVVLRQTPLLRALTAWRTAQPLLAVLGCLWSGFLLHSQGQLDQLRYGWHIQETSVAADVSRRWWRASWLLISGALLLGLLLSSGLLLVPPPPLVPLVNVVLVILTLLLAWLSGGSRPEVPRLPPFQPPQIPVGPTERPLLPALIFWLCVLLLLGVAALRYVQQRQSLWDLMRRWRGTRWLMRWLGQTWQELVSWRAMAAATIRRRWRRRSSAPRRRQRSHGAAGQIQALYRRLVHTASERGVPHPRSQTAYEFRSAAQDALPSASEEIASLTEAYVRAEYGPTPPQPEDVRRARGAWRRIERIFARTGARRRRAPLERKR